MDFILVITLLSSLLYILLESESRNKIIKENKELKRQNKQFANEIMELRFKVWGK